jgi:hypothetical protein
MSTCPIQTRYSECSSRYYGVQACDTCEHYSKENTLNKLLLHYKLLIEFKNRDQKGNYKFTEQFIKQTKKKSKDDWIEESVWFVCQAIDLHMKTWLRGDSNANFKMS